MWIFNRKKTMINQIQISGNLGADPEVKILTDGTYLTKFSIAVASSYKSTDPPMWFKVVAFKSSAEYCSKLRKGDAVVIFGRLQSRTWEGTKYVEIVVKSCNKISRMTVQSPVKGEQLPSGSKFGEPKKLPTIPF